jgi:hypothetical protein
MTDSRNQESLDRHRTAAAAVAAFGGSLLVGACAALMSALGVEDHHGKPLPFPGRRAIAVALLAWPLVTWFVAAMWQALDSPAPAVGSGAQRMWKPLVERSVWAGAIILGLVLLGVIGAVGYLTLRLLAG